MARLLIIPGDNAALRSLPGEMTSDVEVQVLESANDALWEIRQSPPEVVIADINLPGMSGLDLAEIIPNFGVPTKIVLCSREPNGRIAKQAEIAGVHHFVNGPIEAGELKSVLYGMLHPGRSADVAVHVETSTAAEPARPPDPAKPESPSHTTPEIPAVPPSPGPATVPPRRPATRRREGPLVLTADSLTPIRSRMVELLQDVGAQCVLLADRAGMVLAEAGVTAGLPTMILLPLLSTTFSTAGQISQVLREVESSALYMQEGSHFDLYCFDVVQRFMLVIIFDKAASATKIGSVWVYAKRAIRDIQELLA